MSLDLKIISVLLATFLITSCATSPKGENVLMDELNNNRSSKERALSKGPTTIKEGRPIFIKAYAYPQVLNTGDIWGGGNVFVEVGREKFDLNKIISSTK